MAAQLTDIIRDAFEAAKKAGELSYDELPPVILEAPKQAAHGDVACPLALALARQAKRPPREVSIAAAAHISWPTDLISKVEVAGPGYINIHLAPGYWTRQLLDILAAGDRYGHHSTDGGQRVLVEFVSANPTGPLHVGHGRGAVVGDAVARLLTANGHRVDREYYVNNVGNQMNILGRSTHVRYCQLLGRKVDLPENHYQGDYIRDIARRILDTDGEAHADTPEAEWLPRFSTRAYETILDDIRTELNRFGIHFDQWFSERDLYQGAPTPVQSAIADLLAAEKAYEKDGAVWLATTRHGDDKDRVMVRANGVTTYFASDVAYHKEKFSRGYQRLIDVWGADHHGYIQRMKACCTMLGHDPEALTVVLVQLVSLLRDGQPVAMSTRSGEFITLAEVADEIGVDATRFFFLTRKCDAPLEFDLALAKAQTADNPVYYVQYAHARVHQLYGKVLETHGFGRREVYADAANWDLSALTDAETLALIKQITQFPEVVAQAGAELAVHRIPYYLQELAAGFHSYYYKHRFVSDDIALTRARLVLAAAVGQVIHNGLALMGVGAPERM
ncbi:MAG: arginine--tRNA ligase [Nitrospirota bacterium]|nr:arginine--tRNA ligase [Nitrospirota bacterium]